MTLCGVRVSISQNYSYEQVPINKESECILNLSQHPDVLQVQNYATKVGVIKTDDQVEGVVLKGVDETFSWDFFKKNIIQGDGFSTADTAPSNSIIICSPESGPPAAC